MKLNDWFRQRFPFTLLGSLVLLSSLSLLSLSLISGDSLALIVGLSGLILPLILFMAAHFTKPSFKQDSLTWEKTPCLMVNRRTRILTGWEKPYRFRLLFRRQLNLWGSLTVEEQILYRFRSHSGFIKGHCEEELLVPYSGQLNLHGSIFLMDVLGLVRLPLDELYDWECTVFPEKAPMKLDIPELLSESQQDQSRKKKQEQERVFTREYMAGDLSRDINWKASVRIGKLITRIPPESFGDSPLIQVFFRSPPSDHGMHSLFYLEHQKSVLLGFLQALSRGRSEHHFQIFLNRREFMVASDEDMNQFKRELAHCGFTLSYTDYPLPQPGRQSCIFSSVLDSSLKKELTGLNKEELQLFLCIPHSVEQPGSSFQLFQEWPRFLPASRWLRKGDVSQTSYPRQLKGCYYFPLQGGW